MINRRAALSLLLLLAACDAKRSAELEMREKFFNHDCFVAQNKILVPELKKWHSRPDCPDLNEESWYGVLSGKKPLSPITVHTKQDGLYDGEGFKYEHQHCPKCVY
jgi:hypothetical protein